MLTFPGYREQTHQDGISKAKTQNRDGRNECDGQEKRADIGSGVASLIHGAIFMVATSIGGPCLMPLPSSNRWRLTVIEELCIFQLRKPGGTRFN